MKFKKKEFPEIPLIILSERDECNCILSALRYGANSYISTTLNPQVVIQALRLILAGGIFIPPSIFSGMMKEGPAKKNQLNGSETETLQSFTPRQLEVLQLLREGKSNKIIAYELNMQESTVKVHVRQIMKKLKAINRTHAAFLASQIIESESLYLPEP